MTRMTQPGNFGECASVTGRVQSKETEVEDVNEPEDEVEYVHDLEAEPETKPPTAIVKELKERVALICRQHLERIKQELQEVEPPAAINCEQCRRPGTNGHCATCDGRFCWR